MIATLALLLTLSPGDALRLAPPDNAPQPAAMTRPAPASLAPPRSHWPSPVGSLGVGAVLAVAGAVLGGRRRSRGAGRRPAGDPLVVFVSGHGNSSPPGIFAYLASRMGIEPSQARFFDYRWADGGADHGSASEDASIDDTADSLNSYLAGLAEEGQPLYLVGFSKGGAAVAELVGRWDRGDPGPNEAVVGAAMLEPPLASGVHGFLQSVGSHWGPIPDDGGYDPRVCSGGACFDSRQHLGDASGVEVLVVRNPQAGITTFADVPQGLRVYEASDGGPGFLKTLVTRPWDLPHRMAAAHMAVLGDPRVGDCIAAEIVEAGSCDLPRAGYGPPAGLIVHGPGASTGMAINKML